MSRLSLSGFVAVCIYGLLAQPSCTLANEESRFFADCPHRRYYSPHHNDSPWDLHAITYSIMGLSEVELLRAADWLIDLPIPGKRLRPFYRIENAVQNGYSRLPSWRIVQRTGEFIDALQIPELSFGDALTTYSAATGGVTGPGSGSLVRINKLIDWSQHVSGDVNRLLGRLLGGEKGFVSWELPGRAIDGLQWFNARLFMYGTNFARHLIDDSMTFIERCVGSVVNIGYQPPHQETTVFLRMPLDAYRVHEVWILEHRSQISLGTPSQFAHATHAELAHRKPWRSLLAWSEIDTRGSGPSPIILMTNTRLFRGAPNSIKAYVIPAAWVFGAEEERSLSKGSKDSR